MTRFLFPQWKSNLKFIQIAQNVSEDEVAGSVSTSVAGWVVVALNICMAVSIPSLWSSSQLRAVCSAVWHWRLLAPHCRWALSPFCASYSRRFRASRSSWRLRFLAALACVAQFFTGKSCSSLLTLLLKTALLLALVRFWCFLVHSIHSGTFLFQENYKREIVLARSSIPLKSKRAHAHNVWFVLDTHPKSRSRRA